MLPSVSIFIHVLPSVSIFIHVLPLTSELDISDRCNRLVELARKHDVLIVAEDVYNLLHYDVKTKPVPRLFSYDRP